MLRKTIHIDSQTVSFAEFGMHPNFPVFYFHGFPGSHMEGKLLGFEQVASAFGCRFICIDRPGMGKSEYQSERKLLDWPELVEVVADELGLEKYAVMGLSGGGPYALAMAYTNPERLVATAVVSGMPPFYFSSTRYDLAMSLPELKEQFRKPAAVLFRAGVNHAPIWLVRYVMKVLPESDRKVFRDDHKLAGLLETYRSGLRQGVRGYLHEARIYSQPWGFDPGNIKIKVQVWHGAADKNVHLWSAQQLINRMPYCEPHIISNEGHFSVVVNYLPEIIKSIIT